jgi:hypothetical protein
LATAGSRQVSINCHHFTAYNIPNLIYTFPAILQYRVTIAAIPLIPIMDKYVVPVISKYVGDKFEKKEEIKEKKSPVKSNKVATKSVVAKQGGEKSKPVKNKWF